MRRANVDFGTCFRLFLFSAMIFLAALMVVH